jgi:hypothetical protein
MSYQFTDAELEAYLDEGLDPTRAAELEEGLKVDEALLARLSHINGRRDAGIHTLGEIWRRNQIGVPTREQMGNFLLGVSSAEEADYINFRIDVLKCRITAALLQDLKAQQAETDAERSASRRSKIFHSSAGLLKKKDKE